MHRMDRRRFLVSSAATAVSLSGFAQTAPASQAVKLTLLTDQHGPTVPHNFIGLSYETQQLSEPSFFSPKNTGLIAQLRALAPVGVLRLGGNTSDYGFWKPTASSVAPPRAKREYKVGDPPPDLSYAITPEAVRNLRGFLDATGWTCLYGINLGTNTPELAALEAEFVAKILGAKLEYFQIGNEADRFGSTIRDPKTWNADAYLDEWLIFANAILARVPNARFGMPDIASNAQWFTTIGERLASHPIRTHIACLSHHHYVGGPPSNPMMTIERILGPDPAVKRDADLVRAAAAKLGTAWRMTEGNTCYRGGKPGVSDVFAASLWAAEYLLTLASMGYAGVNLHGGDVAMVATSLGGKLPGDEMVQDDPSRHPRPYYTPIAHIGDRYIAEPVSYGMRFAQQFAGATMIPVEFSPGPVNATIFAARAVDETPSKAAHKKVGKTHGTVLLAIINKDATKPLSVDFPLVPSSVDIMSAASLSATEVMRRQEPLLPGADRTVPPHSMAIFRLEP